MDVGEDRSRRAVGWIGVAALGVLVAGVVYLRPSLAPPAAASPPAVRLPLAPAWRLGSVTFGDVDHGLVGFYRMNLPGPVPTTRTFLTSDGGRTWRLVAEGRSGFVLAGFLDRRTVVMQTAAGGGPPNTRLSDDSGHTWRRLTDPRRLAGPGLPAFLDAQHGWWLERPPADPRTPAPITLWRTTDGGRSWRRLAASGLPETGFPEQRVFVDPLRGVLIFTFSDGSRPWLATTDGGDSWQVVKGPDTPLPDTWTRSVILLRHGGRLLAWLQAVSGPPPPNGFLAPPNRTVGVAAFISASDDGGQTWGPPRAGPYGVQSVYASLIPTLDERGRLLLLDNRHLWVSEDDGATWALRVAQMPAGLQPAWFFGAPPGGLFATAFQMGPSDIVTQSTPLTLIRSTDGGAHWSPVSLPRPS